MNIYRQRGRYDVPTIMGHLRLKVFNYRISLIWFNPKRYGNPLQNVKGEFLFEIVTKITDPLNVGISYTSCVNIAVRACMPRLRLCCDVAHRLVAETSLTLKLSSFRVII